MKSTTFLLLIILVLTGWAGCKMIDPDEPSTTFLQVQPFATFDSSAVQSLAKPTTAFVFFNNKSLGTYTLPARVPLITDQAGELRVVPGITKNGTIAYQEPYIPYYSYATTLAPKPGQSVVIAPTTGFRSNVSSFLLEENFESTNQFIYLSGDTCFSVKKVTDCPYCGTGTGVITLDAMHKKSEIISTSFFQKGTKTYFLELNYRNTVDFEVGLALVDNSSAVHEYYMVGFKPKGEWNKVYIPLNQTMNLYGGDQRVFILFKSALPDGTASAQVELDNIRVIAF